MQYNIGQELITTKDIQPNEHDTIEKGSKIIILSTNQMSRLYDIKTENKSYKNIPERIINNNTRHNKPQYSKI